MLCAISCAGCGQSLHLAVDRTRPPVCCPRCGAVVAPPAVKRPRSPLLRPGLVLLALCAAGAASAALAVRFAGRSPPLTVDNPGRGMPPPRALEGPMMRAGPGPGGGGLGGDRPAGGG